MPEWARRARSWGAGSRMRTVWLWVTPSLARAPNRTNRGGQARQEPQFWRQVLPFVSIHNPRSEAVLVLSDTLI